MDQHGATHDSQPDRRTIEGIEACRPQSDDLRSPELADVAQRVASEEPAGRYYERVQRWDSAVAAAMSDVSVPAGLAQRIAARLAAAGAGRDTQAEPGLTAASVEMRRPRRPRRWRLAAASSLAAAAVILVALFFSDLLRPRAEVPWEVMADRWQESLSVKAEAWRGGQPLPRGYAVPAGVLGSVGGWQPLSTTAGVAIRLVRGDGSEAMLYAVRGTSESLPGGPPDRPQSTTGGKAVGYWHGSGVIYVLVVPGDERLYRQFVSPKATPLA